MVGTLVRLLIAVALAAGLGPICVLVLQWVARHQHGWPPDALATVAGVVGGVLFVFWRRPNWFIHTWIHEHCHLLVYVVLHGRMPVNLQVSDGKGGGLEHLETGPIRSTLIQLAPYSLPLLLLPVLVVRHFLVTEPGPWRHVLSGVVAFLYVDSLQALFHNVRLNWNGDQSDLVKAGRPLSFVIIAMAMMLVTAWTLRGLWTGFPSGY